MRVMLVLVVVYKIINVLTLYEGTLYTYNREELRQYSETDSRQNHTYVHYLLDDLVGEKYNIKEVLTV
jgi:hypothetical protein